MVLIESVVRDDAVEPSLLGDTNVEEQIPDLYFRRAPLGQCLCQ